ncbi:transmembrane protein 253 isoform X1 [Rhinichthys klamathensis goyatoka]|uniref:transmembrane protein 253 isoform X1 n=1 Tax=Rhinichthys klamathensis goyatoka TaxID=3034132 RepID=UPI0024B6335A|nr:transmembrane protein 253 isoform X1 [Rhinichthys klamathensis goyatoka]
MPGIPESQMTQNMFQEGLHQVFLKERPLPSIVAAAEAADSTTEDRLVRWFGTVVNTRILLSGVVQIFSAVFCILSTFSYTCLTFSCSASLTAPVWCGLFFIATGSLAIDVQRKPKKFKVMTLMGLNIFGLLFAVCSVFPFFMKSSQLDKATPQQRIGVHVLKGSGVMSILQCMFAAMYSLFLIWRGMQSYSASYRKDYISVMQNKEEHTDPLLENEHFSI